MKKGKIINILLVVGVVALLAVCALAVRIPATADNVVVLKTMGMTCGSCSSNVEKALQPKRGVASVEVDPQAGWVVVGYDSKKVKPEAIASTVTGAGYPSSVMRLLSVEQFRAMTGRNPGDGVSKKPGCGCGAKS